MISIGNLTTMDQIEPCIVVDPLRKIDHLIADERMALSSKENLKTLGKFR
jgi:hypothetical protein